MINKIKNISLKNLRLKDDGMDYTDNPAGSEGTFHLKFDNQLVGTLSYENGKWTFMYSEDFKNNPKTDPIIDFPDVEKTYINEHLWPFFASRIPALNQPFQLKKIKKANANKNNAVDLLKLFGLETITNPFRLYPV